MKAIKILLKYIGWPFFIAGLITGIIFMYNVNANRTALYDVKEYCYGEDCKAFQQIHYDMNDICNQTIEEATYFDGGCVSEDDVKECIINKGYLNCIGKKEFEERESEYYDMRTGENQKIYQRNNIADYITDIKNINIDYNERVTELVEEKREITMELDDTEILFAQLKDNVRLAGCNISTTNIAPSYGFFYNEYDPIMHIKRYTNWSIIE